MIAPTGDKLKLADRMAAFLNYYFADPLKLFMKSKESAERLKADVLGHPPKYKVFLNAGLLLLFVCFKTRYFCKS